MGKFVIQCPYCGAFNKASTSFFARRVIECSCGRSFNVKEERMTTKRCPHCGNDVVYDAAKGDRAVCPVCNENLNVTYSNCKMQEIHCPSCFCKINVNKDASTYRCPLCETEIDVQKEIKKQEYQKEGLISVIRYEGPNDVFVWKSPIEDFNLGSQLIVHESQEAIFFRDGKALDLFGPGRHALETANIPLLKEVYKIPTGGQEVFHTEVYFINMVTQMGIRWGTDSKVRMFDPVSNLHVEIGACGQFNIRVNDSRKLLMKVVGTTNGLGQNDIITDDFTFRGMTGKFKALIMSKVKANLAKVIRENDINILEVDEHIDEISEILKTKINEVLVGYGLIMPEFFVTTILTPDDDPNFKRMKEQYAERFLKVQEERILQAEAEAAQKRKIVEAQTSAQTDIIAAQAKAQAYKLQAEAEAAEMQMKGYTSQQETARQVATAAVEHQGGGMAGSTTGVLNDMVGLGVGLGVMGEVVNTVKGTVNPMMGQAASAGQAVGTSMNADPNAWECPNCHSKNTNFFCATCGTKKPEANVGWDCTCGQKGIMTNFCPHCGSKKPEEIKGWDCSCGQKGIKSNFCPNCGAKKPEEPTTWNCECGQQNIVTMFCPNCGKKRD